LHQRERLDKYLLLETPSVDASHLQRSVDHPQLLTEIKRPLFAVASDGHALVHRDKMARLI
jgi:hypothetical protein